MYSFAQTKVYEKGYFKELTSQKHLDLDVTSNLRNLTNLTTASTEPKYMEEKQYLPEKKLKVRCNSEDLLKI